ncbi:MAG: ribonuclease H-like domain-containing protein [Methanolinea sp.]|nr:ribonuclease H-like domain-containing protein [Methanolinea sp.]
MTYSMAFETASKVWRERIDRNPEYTIIRNDRVVRTSYSDSYVLQSDYEAILRLKRDLLRRYSGSPLEEALPGMVEETPEGDCYCITSRERISVPDEDADAVLHELVRDFTLIFGIGKRKDRELRERGYSTIRDLRQHRRFGPDARRCLEILEAGDPCQIQGLVSRWHSRSHPLSMLTAALYGREQFLFLDLETLGIYQRPIILIGIAGVEGDSLVIRQYLLRSVEEELPALLAALRHMGQEKVFVTYNGRTFDIPYLRERYTYYGEHARLEHPHFDMLHPARRQWRDRFPDCRLTTLEKELFGVVREHDVPGALVPEFYETFLTTGNPGPLVPVVMHNRQDLISLARLFCLFREGGP